jgi:hypothetical protein
MTSCGSSVFAAIGNNSDNQPLFHQNFVLTSAWEQTFLSNFLIKGRSFNRETRGNRISFLYLRLAAGLARSADDTLY